jgi:hypothetical protein
LRQQSTFKLLLGITRRDLKFVDPDAIFILWRLQPHSAEEKVTHAIELSHFTTQSSANIEKIVHA